MLPLPLTLSGYLAYKSFGCLEGCRSSKEGNIGWEYNNQSRGSRNTDPNRFHEEMFDRMFERWNDLPPQKRHDKSRRRDESADWSRNHFPSSRQPRSLKITHCQNLSFCLKIMVLILIGLMLPFIRVHIFTGGQSQSQLQKVHSTKQKLPATQNKRAQMLILRLQCWRKTSLVADYRSSRALSRQRWESPSCASPTLICTQTSPRLPLELWA